MGKKKAQKGTKGGGKGKESHQPSSSSPLALPYVFRKDQEEVTFKDAIQKLEILIDNPESFVAPPPELGQVRQRFWM